MSRSGRNITRSDLNAVMDWCQEEDSHRELSNEETKAVVGGAKPVEPAVAEAEVAKRRRTK